MAPRNTDAWLWAGLAILGYYAAMTVHQQLLSIRKASEITHHDKPPDMLSQQTENALKLETLGQLAENANQDIRAASVRILTERVLHGGEAWRLMIQDILGYSGPEGRCKALACLRFILPSTRTSDKGVALVFSRLTYTAIISCLCALLPEAREAECGSANDSAYRTQAERDAIYILDFLLPFHTQEAIEAGIIERWLRHYPFGGPQATLPEKQRTMYKIYKGTQAYEDSDFGYAMQSILDRVFRVIEFREEMKKYFLIDIVEDDVGMSIPVRYPAQQWLAIQTALEHIPEGAIRIEGGWSTGMQEFRDDPTLDLDLPLLIPEGAVRTRDGLFRRTVRRREESLEEQALRRRRREAIVLGENGRPIQSGDIIQRDPVILDEEVEEDLVQVIEEVTEVEGRSGWSWWEWLRRIRPDGLAPLPRPDDSDNFQWSS